MTKWEYQRQSDMSVNEKEAPMKVNNDCMNVVFIMIFAICSAGRQQNPKSDQDAFLDWAKKNASEIKTLEPGSGFDDLRTLQKSIGDARLVFIGESRHDAHEHFKCKRRLVEFLVEEMGFTLFAMEESLPYGDRINKYILGGEGDPEVLLSNMGNWYVWDTKEVLALIQWMRKYNSDPAHEKKVEFCGIDVTDPMPAIENTLAYLEKVDPESAGLLKANLEKAQLFHTDLRSERDITERYLWVNLFPDFMTNSRAIGPNI
jgi:erythromycin esterase-like protein